MARRGTESSLYDPRRGGEPLRAAVLDAGPGEFEPSRSNCFGVYCIEAGRGSASVGEARHPFAPRSLLFSVPYQDVRFHVEEPLAGSLIQFHANFLCVETFHAEAGCAGTLFGDPLGVPVLPLEEGEAAEIFELAARIGRESTERGLAYREAALAYLKVLLVLATRRKSAEGDACAPGPAAGHPLLARFRALIEAEYRRHRAPAWYARALHVSPKTLGRVVRERLGATPTALIRARILTHAKWQLLHTLRSVKEIAAEVGFDDELYFSRLFKKFAGVSPTFFREFETEIRGGSNLSIPSGVPSIPPLAAPADNQVDAPTGPSDREVAPRRRRRIRTGG